MPITADYPDSSGGAVYDHRLLLPERNLFFAWVLVSRLYCYVSVGAAVTLTTNKLNLIRSLEQNCHLPSKVCLWLPGSAQPYSAN